MATKAIKPTLTNPLDPPEKVEFTIPGEISRATGPYEEAMKEGHDLIQRPIRSVSIDQIEKQHAKKRMTVWERIRVLSDEKPLVLFQNWGKNLDGASLVTAVLNIGGRDVAVYGHDFTVRAGSMDATNGSKLAKLFRLAGDRGIPLIGMNDSAGAFVPASAASTATPRPSRRCARSAAWCPPSCACSASTPAAAPTCRGRAAS
jgi:acetyl-CoA carboxylase carboxyltransferase component